jgi:hypothetical protein
MNVSGSSGIGGRGIVNVERPKGRGVLVPENELDTKKGTARQHTELGLLKILAIDTEQTIP